MFVRMATIATGAVAALALSVAPASAHFCYNAHAVEKGLTGMSQSNGFTSFGEMAFEFTGLCPAGIEVLAHAAGVEPYTAVHDHAIMARGSNGKSKGISYVDFDGAIAAIPEAIAACESPEE